MSTQLIYFRFNYIIKFLQCILGKFIALNKWECANQIGSITLHHSSDGKVALLIAQPGGTFMRIKCQLDDHQSENLETSGQNNDGR